MSVKSSGPTSPVQTDVPVVSTPLEATNASAPAGSFGTDIPSMHVAVS